MYIWLITVGEPLPIDGKNDRLYRSGILANILEKQGHKVAWWTSTVDHVRKRQRFETDKSVTLSSNLRLVCLHSLLYRKNISFRRIINHIRIARKFRILSKHEEKPDIILCSFPTIELSAEAVKYGRSHGVPVVLDVRDLWPDLFLDSAPQFLRPFARLALAPMFKTTREVFTNASAITGVTEGFVDWGLRRAGRGCDQFDRVFPMAYSLISPTKQEIVTAERFWFKHNIIDKNRDFIVCFFGAFGRQFDLNTVIEATRKLDDSKAPIRFVLCGSGENFNKYKHLAKVCKNILFPGWVGHTEIWTLMRMASVGLAPYISTNNFMLNIANKPIEYMSAGLPVVSSSKGALEKLLSTHDCGITYQNGDVDALASILHDLHKNRERLRKLSDNALALFKDKFMAEKVYGEMSRYLERIAANKELYP